MNLTALIRKGGFGRTATATTATLATQGVEKAGTVAPVATVAVASPQELETDTGICWVETETPEAMDAREARRERVLAMLAANPSLERAYLVEPDAYPSAASVFIANRDKSFEVLIPRKWFDRFAVAELVRSWV